MALGLLLGAIAVALGTTSFVYHRATLGMDAASAAITESVAPSMEDLAAVRGGAFRIGFFLAQFINAPPHERLELNRQIEKAITETNDAALRYTSHPQLPGEREHVRALAVALRDLEAAVDQLRDLVAADRHAEEIAVLNSEFRAAAENVVAVASAASRFNATAGEGFSRDMRALRQRTRMTNFAVEAVFAALVAAAALWLRRRARDEQRELRREAAVQQERSAELELFAGRVAHDIRNPIAASLVASHLILRKTEDSGLRELANRISGSLSRATKIIEGLLDFARSGAKPDPGARTDVRAATEELVAGILPDATASGIELTALELPQVQAICSEGVFHSLLGNLVRNAIKYMGDSDRRRIDISGRMAGPRVRIEIADTGPGIAAEDQQALFEPYFRVGSVKAEGIGLGLSTVRRLAEGHGGAVGVESVEGRGSVFWFELPVAGRSSATSPARAPAPAGSSTHASLHS